MHGMHESTVGCPGVAARRREPVCTGGMWQEGRHQQGAHHIATLLTRASGAPGLGRVERGGAEVWEWAALLGRDEQRRAHWQRHQRLACLDVRGCGHPAQPCSRSRSPTSDHALFPARSAHAARKLRGGVGSRWSATPTACGAGALLRFAGSCGPAGAHCLEGVSPLKSAMRRCGASMPMFAAQCSSALSAFAGAASA